MAKTKQAGKTAQHTTRPGKRLGLKKFGGEMVKTGQIIVRQKGTKYHPASGVGRGRDQTLFALRDGVVEYKVKHGKSLVTVE